MKTKILIVTVVFAAVFFTACQSETVTSGNISGIVSDLDTDEPLGAVYITLMPTGKNTYTGMAGDFEFTDLEAGQYRINVQKSGYQVNRKVANVMAGETTTVFIAMLKDYSE